MNCSVASWTNTEIESTAGVNGVLTYIGVAAASTRDQLLATALTFDSEGNATILYPLGNGSTVAASTSGHLKRVNISTSNVVSSETFKSGSNASGSVIGAGAVVAVNMAVAGHNVDSVQTINDELVSVFVDSGNILSSRSCGLE